jgi:phage tail-like protein
MMDFASFHVGTQEEWDAWESTNIEVADGKPSIRKNKQPDYIKPVSILNTNISGYGIVDITVDDCGDLYILYKTEKQSDDGSMSYSGELHRFDPKTGLTDRIDDLGDADKIFVNPVAICVTKNDLYIANGHRDNGEDGNVHIFSRQFLQLRRTITEVKNPVALATDGELVYVLEKEQSHLAVISSTGKVTTIVQNTVEDESTGLDITVDVSGTPYLLTKTRGRYQIVKIIASLNAGLETEIKEVRTNDALCIEATKSGQLIVGTDLKTDTRAGGNGATLFRYLYSEDKLEAVNSYRKESIRIATPSGHASSGPGLYVVSEAGTTVFFLSEVTQTTLNTSTGRYDGSLYTFFDSGIIGTRWHRLTLDFDQRADPTTGPRPGMQIKVSYAAQDTLASPSTIERAWTTIRPNPRDAFISDAEGRYLWIKIDLLGNEYASPQIQELRVYFPHQSYLRYLPAIYQEDEQSRRLLAQFLSIFESIFVDIEQDILSSTKYLDSAGIPAEYLSWLGQWLALEMDQTWSETAKRELLAKAPMLFKKRGTREGLVEILQIYTAHLQDETAFRKRIVELEAKRLKSLVDQGSITSATADRELGRYKMPTFLIEYSDLECIENSNLKDQYRQLVGCPQCFVILVQPFLTDEQKRTIDRIVKLEKPAHSVGTVVKLHPIIELDEHSYLGINSALARPDLLLERSRLEKDSMLTEQEDLHNSSTIHD